MALKAKSQKQNLTLVIDREVLRDARRYALEHDTTVNELVRSYLADIRREETKREAARALLATSMEQGLGEATGEPFNREEIYERSAGSA